jgi:uncharacterized protein (DUF1810 family)
VADPFDLHRFLTAQAVNYADAIRELQAGRKESHWMWYVLPQLRGLGHSDFAIRYGLTGLEEARAYVAHPILGPRLLDCARAILSHPDRSAEEIMGRIDGRKLQSTATLFALADDGAIGEAMRAILTRHYGGESCPRTLAAL